MIRKLVSRIVTILTFILLLGLPSAWAQTKKVSGTVTNSASKAPVEGASVQVKGSSNGTATSGGGTFELMVSPSAKTLVISSVGYDKQEVSIPASGVVNVSLTPQSTNLSDIVVVGYGGLKRSQLTSAVASVKPEDFNQIAAKSPMDLIQGKVAGVNVSRPGGPNPNSSAFYQIRSATSINGNTNPLIVIDGVPYAPAKTAGSQTGGANTAMDLIQPDDIASFDILKDGSAAAIYGTQANGGVILITTKKGKGGAPRFDFSTYQSKLIMRQHPEFLTAQDYRSYANNGSTVTQGMKSYTQGVYSTNPDQLTPVENKDNLTSYYNFAMTGGGPNGNYRASVWWQHQDGYIHKNARRNYGARLGINQRGLDNRLSVQVNGVVTYNNADREGMDAVNSWNNALVRLPTTPIYDSTSPSGFYSANGIANPLSDLTLRSFTRTQTTLSTDGKVTLDIWKGLKAGVAGSIYRDLYQDNEYHDLYSDDSRYNGDYPNGGYAQIHSELDTRYDFNPTIEFNRTFGDHNFTAVAGYDYTYAFFSDNSIQARGFQNDLLLSNSIGAASSTGAGKTSVGTYKEDYKDISVFGRIAYDYQDKYMAQVIFRREGNSKFGVNNKWANFPAASIGWDIARENFMKQFTKVNQLKLRAGYGATGNSNINPYLSLVTLGTGGQTVFPNGQYLQTWGPTTNPQPNLQWELKKEWNLGLDFAAFNNRLTGSLDLFYRKTTKVLLNYPAQQPPLVSSMIWANVGAFNSKGVELNIGYQAVRTKNFSWKTSIVASSTSNRITNLSNGTYHVGFYDYGGIPGYGALGNALRLDSTGKVGNFYGHKFAGFDANGSWLMYNAAGKAVPYAQVGDADKRILGNAIPKLYLTWGNSFTYKNFDLAIQWRGKFGFKILDAVAISYGNNAQLPNNVLKETFTKYSQIHATYQYSDYYLYNGNFLKLDNVNLGYTFHLKTDLIKSLRVYVSGQNLAIITKYPQKSGNDPDMVLDQFNPTAGTQGIDNITTYPALRNYLIGLNVGF